MSKRKTRQIPEASFRKLVKVADQWGRWISNEDNLDARQEPPVATADKVKELVSELAKHIPDVSDADQQEGFAAVLFFVTLHEAKTLKEKRKIAQKLFDHPDSWLVRMTRKQRR